MAKASINFEKATQHSIAHNFREEKKEPHYLLPKEHRLENEYWRNEKTAKELFDAELQKAERKGGRVPKFENSHWEGVLNLNREHTLEDVQRVAKHIEGKLNVTCTSIAIHRDEGHINERGIVQYNLHAHLNFQTYKDGKQNWRLEHVKKELPQLQTDVAKMLNMTRGKEKSNALHLKPKAFREAVTTLANENDLKAEIAQLRATLKEMGGKREDYAKLEALTKDLKERVKSQIITIDDLKEQINAHKTLINDLQSKNKALDKEIATKDEKINSRANMSVKEITEKEADKELVTLIKSHYEVQTVYDKSEQKGFLGTKEVYQKTQKNVLHEPKTFFEKVKDLAVKGSAYIQDKYNRLMVAYGKLEEKHSEALSRVKELEKELKEARAELQSLKGQKVGRYEQEMRVNRDFEEYEGYRYKHDSEMNNERKDIKAQIAQQESKIAHIEEKLENAKDKYELAYDEVNARASSMSDSERKYANEWSKKLAYAKATKREVPTYEYLQTKQGYNNKLNEIPKLPEEQEQKPKTKKPLVRE